MGWGISWVFLPLQHVLIHWFSNFFCRQFHCCLFLGGNWRASWCRWIRKWERTKAKSGCHEGGPITFRLIHGSFEHSISQIHRTFWKEMDANLHIHVVSRSDHTALEKVPQSMSQDIDWESTRLDSCYSIGEAWLFMGQLCLVQTLRKSCHLLQ